MTTIDHTISAGCGCHGGAPETGSLHQPSGAGEGPVDYPPIACSLTGEELAQRTQSFGDLLRSAQRVDELESGYAFRFPGDAATLALLTENIAAERACCPFFDFSLTLEHNLGPVWVQITGPAGVKEMLQPAVEGRSDVRTLGYAPDCHVALTIG
jgi:hypothetical protein